MIARGQFPGITIPAIPFTPFVLRHAERLAAKPALIDGATGRTYTYGQLAAAVRRVAAGLAQRGFTKGDVIALYSPNLPEYPIPLLAAALTRCNYYNQSEFWRKARDFCLKKGSEICRVAPNGTGCYAVSSCDTAPVLLTFGATVRIASRTGDRIAPVGDLYSDDGIHSVRLHDGEVLTDIYLPALEGDWRSAYEKYRIRGAFDFPIVGVAVAARFDGDTCTDARLVLQAVATQPLPLPEAEVLLRGQSWTPELLEAAAEIAYRAAHPMDNTSGTIALRRRMVRAYTRRALESLLAFSG